MSPVPGEQQALHEIENGLRRSDPELAAMFARLADAEARRPAARRASIVFLIAICALFAASLAIALFAAAQAGTRDGALPAHTVLPAHTGQSSGCAAVIPGPSGRPH